MMNLAQQLDTLKHAVTKADKQAVILQYQNDVNFMTALHYRFDVNENVQLSAPVMNQFQIPVHSTTFVELTPYFALANTNDQKVTVINAFLNQFQGTERQLLVQLLTKQLALGLGIKTLNQTIPHFVDVFAVQLAYPYAKKINGFAKDQQFIVTQKLDGHRNATIIKWQNGQPNVTFYSRTGQVRLGLSQLRAHVVELINAHPQFFAPFQTNGVVLDGEIIAEPMAGETTVQRFQRTSDLLDLDGEKTDLGYHIFDVVPMAEFNGRPKTPYATRRDAWLNPLAQLSADDELVSVVAQLAIIDQSQIGQWSQYAIERGWEGVMLNTVNGLYHTKRTRDLLKVKQMHTADLPIVGFSFAGDYLQTVNVRLSKTMVVPVGSGLNDDLRAEMARHKDQYIGAICEVQYFEKMTANHGETLRFPVFKTMRWDKTVDDVNIE